MKSSTKQFLSIFLTLLLIAGAAFIFFNLLLVKWRTTQTARAEVAEKTAVRNQLAQITAKAQELLVRFEDVDRQAEPISRAIPESPKLHEVLAILGTLASQNNLSVGQVVFDDILTSRSPQGAVSSPKAVSVRTTVALTGRYSDFKNWLKAVETELRLIDIEEIGIQNPSAKDGADTLSFSASLFVYYQLAPASFAIPSRAGDTQAQ